MHYHCAILEMKTEHCSPNFYDIFLRFSVVFLYLEAEVFCNTYYTGCCVTFEQLSQIKQNPV